jgi:predicted HTH transcriptional regulator
VSAKRLLVNPAVEAQLSQRQRDIVRHVAEAGSVTTGWCMKTLDVVRDTAHRDLVDLVKRSILIRQGSGRGAVYALRERTSENGTIR